MIQEALEAGDRAVQQKAAQHQIEGEITACDAAARGRMIKLLGIVGDLVLILRQIPQQAFIASGVIQRDVIALSLAVQRKAIERLAGVMLIVAVRQDDGVFRRQVGIDMVHTADVLLDEYGVLKIDERAYGDIDKSHIVYACKSDYGYICLTDARQFYLENYKDIVVEKNGIDEFMKIAGKGIKL